MSKIQLSLRFLELSMQFLLIHIVMSAGNTFFHGNFFFLPTLHLGIFFLLLVSYSAVRAKVKSLFLFTALHIGLLVALFFLAVDIPEKILFLAAGVIAFIRSFRYRLMEKHLYQERPHIMMLSVFVIVAFIAEYQKWEGLRLLACFEIIAFILFYLVHEQLQNMEDFLKLNEDVENLPQKQMRGISRILLAFFLIVSLIGMFFLPKLHLEVILKQIGLIFLFLTRKFFSLFRFKEEEQEILSEIETEVNIKNDFFEIERTELLWLARFLEQIMRAAVLIGFVIFIGYLLYSLYRKFYEKKEYGIDEKESLFRENRADVISVVFRSKKQDKSKKNVNEKMRKAYKRAVRKRRRKKDALFKIPKNLTPREIEWYLSEEKRDIQKRERLASLYEKARYDEEICSKEELEEMKEIIKNL